jgi:hypothetical protein
MHKRALTTAATLAILFGATMLATRADAVTVAVPSRLRAAAATTDLPRPVQYFAGGAIAILAGAMAATVGTGMAATPIAAMADTAATATVAMVIIIAHITTAMVDILMPGPVGAIGGAGGDGVGRALSRPIASRLGSRAVNKRRLDAPSHC